MDFLKVIGPDALINQFTVNCLNPDGSSQGNIDVVNDLQDLIFNELTCKYFNLELMSTPFTFTCLVLYEEDFKYNTKHKSKKTIHVA